MLVAVTGSTGLVGGYLVRELRRAGHEVRALARQNSDISYLENSGVEIQFGDLRDDTGLKKFVEGAGCVVQNAVDFSICGTDQIANFEVNLLGSLKLLEWSRQAGCSQFIFISSCAVHDRILDDRPLDEAHPLWPNSTYGAYKAAVEPFLYAYWKSFGFNASAYRPCAIYGLRFTQPKRSRWYNLVQRVVNGERIETASGGKVVHVEDIAGAVVAAIGKDTVAGEVFELADCHIYDQVVAEIAKELSHSPSEIVDLKGTGPKHQIVCDKARSILGIGLNRGVQGVRDYVGQLLEVIK